MDERQIFPLVAGRSEEADFFVALMRKLERFCGIRVVSFTLLPTHYHIVCEVPAAVGLSDSELLVRIEALYGPKRRQSVARAFERSPPGTSETAQRIRQRYLKRMFNLSVFQKELKGRFAQWYNKRHRRSGALWAERFRSILVEAGQALTAMRAYIDLAIRRSPGVRPHPPR